MSQRIQAARPAGRGHHEDRRLGELYQIVDTKVMWFLHPAVVGLVNVLIVLAWRWLACGKRVYWAAWPLFQIAPGVLYYGMYKQVAWTLPILMVLADAWIIYVTLSKWRSLWLLVWIACIGNAIGCVCFEVKVTAVHVGLGSLAFMGWMSVLYPKK